MRKHALLSPSGAHRWLTCTPSAKLESLLPDKPSEYADEGTLAHELSELLIAYAVGLVTKHDYEVELKVLKTRKFYSVSLHEYCEDFKSYVMERFNECRAKDRKAIIKLESRLDLTAYIPDGFGTADITIISNGKLILIDLKFGEGVPVDCEENEQLMIYGLGAHHKYDCFFDIDIVELHIYQPRINNTSSWSITLKALLKWAETVLVPGALAAHKGEGDFEAGSHCQFCRAKPRCATLKKFVDDLYNPKLIPGLITKTEVAEVLLKESIVKQWLNAISEYALEEALQKGTKWPGFKLVEGISRRQINEEKAIPILQDLKLARSDYMRTELKPLGDLEKLVGKKTFDKVFEPAIFKPKGKPALVPITDKREELNSADSVFKDIDFETET